MKETTIKALLELFALIANVREGQISTNALNLIKRNLEKVIAREKIGQYLAQFYTYLGHHNKVRVSHASDTTGLKKRSSQSVKALKICEESNKTLQQHEKIRILSRLIEFSNEDGIITDKELEFLETVKNAFHISDNEYNDIKAVIINPWLQGVNRDKLVVIDRSKLTGHSLKHLYWKELEGMFLALYIESANMFMIKYLGNEEYFRNSIPMLPQVVEFLDTDSLISGVKISPIYFSTISARFIQEKIRRNLEFIAKDVEYKFWNSPNGVQQFSFSARSGDLIGIMGGSGVGKSTLLNVFNGNLKPLKGHIYLNGYDIHRYTDELEGIIGYIPQDDLLIDDLTVFQNLYYNAKLCFGAYSEIQILKTVAGVLKDLDLYEIKHLKVGNPREKFISGGQRKRLNIGLELLRQPMVMFVDEPTSGLSSMDAESVMHLLNRQAIQGKIVVVNIHQPSSDIYKLFTKTLVMDRGGYVIYQGDPLQSMVYFKTEIEQINPEESQCPTCGNVNPEQVLEIVESKFVNEFGGLTGIRRYSAKMWNEKYRERIESHQKIEITRLRLPEINFKVPDLWKQFLIYTARDVRAKFENKQYLLITMLEAPLLALIIGYFTKYFTGTEADPSRYVFFANDNLVPFLFMSVIVSLFLGMIVSAEEIIKDVLILKRESFLHLNRLSYVGSKILIVFVISAFQMFLFVIIGNYMLEVRGMTFKFWLLLFSGACAANLIGLNISAALKTVASIYIVIPLILVPLILFSGTVVSFDKLRTLSKHSRYVPVIGNLMTSRWMIEALNVEQYKNNKFGKHFFEQDQLLSEATFKTSFLLPRLVGLLDEAGQLIESNSDDVKLNFIMQLQRNEMASLARETGLHPGSIIWNFTPGLFTHDVHSKAKAYLNRISKRYESQARKANNERDRIYYMLEGKLGGRPALLEMQSAYTNRSITNLVLNRSQSNKIIEHHHHLIQRMDPVYQKPVSRWGQAHMFAPVKRIGPYEIDTYWFNLAVIWFSTMLAITILYHDLLKRGMNSLEALRLRRLDRIMKRTQAMMRLRVIRSQNEKSHVSRTAR